MAALDPVGLAQALAAAVIRAQHRLAAAQVAAWRKAGAAEPLLVRLDEHGPPAAIPAAALSGAMARPFQVTGATLTFDVAVSARSAVFASGPELSYWAPRQPGLGERWLRWLDTARGRKPARLEISVHRTHGGYHWRTRLL